MKKSYLRAMNFTSTYPLLPPHSDIGGYRYFFNGQEADDEVFGEGVSLSAEFWQYDTRLGRRWNVDPVFKEYESPYACFAGNPVRFADPNGEEVWEPDKEALNNNGEVRFIAQKGDDLHSLATQTGLDYDYLNSLYGDISFNEGVSYSFDKIPAVSRMNEYLQNGMNCENYNCRSFALFVNGILDKRFESDPKVVSEQLQNVSSISRSTIGDVISLAETYEDFCNQYWTHYDNPYWYSEDAFYDYYINGYSTRIVHYSVVLLKSPDGNDISWIIEKRGKNNVNISPFPSSLKTDDEGEYYQPYNPIPIQAGHSTFLYRQP